MSHTIEDAIGTHDREVAGKRCASNEDVARNTIGRDWRGFLRESTSAGGQHQDNNGSSNGAEMPSHEDLLEL
jgi:hypothetical protein